MRTYSPTPKDLSPLWHLFDAKEQTLGRLSTRIATILMGKHKPEFSRHLIAGDHVVVINSAAVLVTGKKEIQKIYYTHSGYPGGLKATPLKKLRSTKPTSLITHAVSGMLPDNKLKRLMLRRLHVFPSPHHTFTQHFPKSSSLTP